MLFDDAAHRTYIAGQSQRQHQFALDAIATHAFNRDGFQCNPSWRHNAGFHAAIGT